MTDSPDRASAAPADQPEADAESGATNASDPAGAAAEPSTDGEDLEALRKRVEEEYDFEDFGPADMASMEPEEWDAAFDPDTWITGEALLDRVEADLKHRIATRDIFAVVERVTHDGEPAVLAYTDNGYALIEPDGSIEGFGTVLRDARPVVALCSMDSYDVPEAPDEDYLLPHPEEVPTASNELGNLMMQVIGGALTIAGVLLLLASFLIVGSGLVGGVGGGFADAGGGALVVTFVIGFVFVLVGLVLFVTVANARLSDSFRAEEYRDRLRRMGLDDGERPDFLPVEGRARELSEEDRGDA